VTTTLWLPTVASTRPSSKLFDRLQAEHAIINPQIAKTISLRHIAIRNFTLHAFQGH
jgi:hypothetical protein